MTIKITDPSGKANGYRMGVVFVRSTNPETKETTSVAYTDEPLNHGQISAIGRWGYTAVDVETKKDVVAPILAKHKEELAAQAKYEQETYGHLPKPQEAFVPVQAPAPPPTVSGKGGK